MEQDQDRAQNAPTPQAVTVSIYGQPYHLRGVDPDHIERLAALVDAKMRAVSAQGHTVDTLRVAVLAALNIADELANLSARYDELKRRHRSDGMDAYRAAKERLILASDRGLSRR